MVKFCYVVTVIEKNKFAFIRVYPSNSAKKKCIKAEYNE